MLYSVHVCCTRPSRFSACNFEKLGVAWLARLLGGTQQVVHLKESDDVRVVQPLHTGDLTRQQLPSMLVQLSLVYDLHSNLLCKRRGREREREILLICK